MASGRDISLTQVGCRHYIIITGVPFDKLALQCCECIRVSRDWVEAVVYQCYDFFDKRPMGFKIQEHQEHEKKETYEKKIP